MNNRLHPHEPTRLLPHLKFWGTRFKKCHVFLIATTTISQAQALMVSPLNTKRAASMILSLQAMG